MMTEHAHDIQAEVRRYLMVFGALLFLTVVTVGVSYLHLEIHEAIILALIIACIKASLVACYFMHLISERRLIYLVMGFTVFFFLGLLLLPVTESRNTIQGMTHHVTSGHSPAVH